MTTMIINSRFNQFKFNYEIHNNMDNKILTTKIINTQSKTFKFNDEFNSISDDMPHYMLTINVTEFENKYKKLYYEINYKLLFVPSNNVNNNEEYKISAHPFVSFNNDYTKSDNVIVYKNSLTQILIDFLLMDYIPLQEHSGRTTSQRYKSNIIESLALLKIKINNYVENTIQDMPHYIFSIIAKETEYENGEQFYDIEYKYRFIPSDRCTPEENKKYKKLAHPFAIFNNLDTIKFDGVIVYKNSLTEIFVEFLLMDYEDLKEHIDLVTAQYYKSNIIEALSLLWD